MATNIVLLSDGTGNSSASPFKTNVWRLYQAIDIMPPADDTLPRQIVYYDNGVGTENFKPLAALGGALGIGVWQNVKDLYAFVCRNFQPGDQIYGFGFSRGAFTIAPADGADRQVRDSQDHQRSRSDLLRADGLRSLSP